jgi:uncharacterized surface protein with fasciclin (FAS1) repeats
MKTHAILTLTVALALCGCDEAKKESPTGTGTASAASAKPASTPNKAPMPPLDPTNIVSIATGSKDHTTLVSALQQAEYVDSVANPGPFTVFAPTNAAFDKVPKATLDGLMKDDKKADLREILKYHVAVSVYQAKDFKDGQVMAMANGAKVTFHVKDGKVMINDATIVASIPASNGIVHVIDGVLLPPAK